MTGPLADRLQESAGKLKRADLQRLKRRVIEASGLQFYEDKDDLLAERVEQRRRLLGCSSAAYVARALDPQDGEELAALIDELTVGETYFFRYPEQFDALRKAVLAERIASHPQDPVLRVWSAGCASGAEPFSLSILLRRDLADLMTGWRMSILATDINRKAIASARAGIYTNWELRTATDDLKRQCFVANGGRWEIRDEFRADVHFAQQNLVTDMDAFVAVNRGAFDIIFCRNVMIYFDADLMRRLLRAFGTCLARGGWLFVGHAEPYFEIANFFVPTVVGGMTLYRKPDAEFDRSGGTANAVRTWPDDGGAAPAARWEWPDLTGATQVQPADSLPAAAPSAAWSAPPEQRREEASDASLPPAFDRIRRRADTGEWNAALDECDAALRENPTDPGLHYLHALIAEHRGEDAMAEQALGRAIYLDRGFALAHYHLGRCQAARGERKGAARSFGNVLKLLADRRDGEPVAMGDGMVVAELRELARGLLERSGQGG